MSYTVPKLQIMMHCDVQVLLYHFDRVFTGCDAWRSWTLPSKVHGRNLAWWVIKNRSFWAKNVNRPQNYKIVSLSWSSQLAMTPDEIPGTFISGSPVTHDWTIGRNGTVFIYLSITVILPMSADSLTILLDTPTPPFWEGVARISEA